MLDTVEAQERAAQNQALFREVNERVGKLTETLNQVTLRRVVEKIEVAGRVALELDPRR